MNATRSFATSVLICLALAAADGTSADVTCICFQPPGGDCSCRDNQIAVCKIRNNVCKATCYDAPARDDNRQAVARIISDMFDVPPEAFGYSAPTRGFPDLQSWQTPPIRSVLQQLVNQTEAPPRFPIGYQIKFNPDERLVWTRFVNIDPGPEIRLGISQQLTSVVRSGAQELLAALGPRH